MKIYKNLNIRHCKTLGLGKILNEKKMQLIGDTKVIINLVITILPKAIKSSSKKYFNGYKCLRCWQNIFAIYTKMG